MTFCRYCALLLSSALLLGFACPTEDPPLPSRLGSPSIDSLSITGYNHNGMLREAICVKWHGPEEKENLSVSSYSIYRMGYGDSGYARIVHSVNHTVNEYFDPIHNIEFPKVDQNAPLPGYKTVYYRILATDDLGRESDTSVVESLWIACQPRIDSVAWPHFGWSVTGIPTGYKSHMFIWNNDSLLWQSPVSNELTFGGEPGTRWIPFSVACPVILPSGHYFWGAHVNAVHEFTVGTLIIDEFTIP